MHENTRNRMLDLGGAAVALAIVAGASGPCLFGSCPTGRQVALAAGPAAGSAPKAPADAPAPVRAPAKVVTRNFEITGMFCAGCAAHVMREIKAVPGVHNVRVDYETGKGTITYESGRVAPEALIEAIKKAGYGAKPST